jgi:hypothetical protein
MPDAASEPSHPLSPTGAKEMQAGGSLGTVGIYVLHLLTHEPIVSQTGGWERHSW